MVFESGIGGAGRAIPRMVYGRRRVGGINARVSVQLGASDTGPPRRAHRSSTGFDVTVVLPPPEEGISVHSFNESTWVSHRDCIPSC